jgi:hypothetical protein
MLMSAVSLLIILLAITQHGVRLALAEEDAAVLARDDGAPIHDDMTPAMLISSGLDIESQQCIFLFKVFIIVNLLCHWQDTT